MYLRKLTSSSLADLVIWWFQARDLDALGTCCNGHADCAASQTHRLCVRDLLKEVRRRERALSPLWPANSDTWKAVRDLEEATS